MVEKAIPSNNNLFSVIPSGTPVNESLLNFQLNSGGEGGGSIVYS